jgi:beta-glucosidase
MNPTNTNVTASKKFPYRDSSLPIADRVADLLSRMSLEEKLEQMHCSGCAYSLAEQLDFFKKGTPKVDGEFYSYTSFGLTDLHELIEKSVSTSRLGIPPFMATENTHGGTTPYTTIFPTPGCFAASFDDDLVYRVARKEGEELRAIGFNKVYAPNLDLLRDPRWGRSEEDYGEDPYLTSHIGSAVVKGLQEEGVAATIKHYLAYSAPEAGLNCSNVSLGEREIRQYFLPPFAAAVKAGAYCVMSCYNSVDGFPMIISKHWMKDVLRDELGFAGSFITDYGVAGMLNCLYRVVPNRDLKEIGKRYLTCGVDLEACGRDAFGPEFKEAVEKGEIPLESIDQSVARSLTIKFKLGLFEKPSFDLAKAKKSLFTPEARELCYQLEKEGAVLLKNEGILPLKGQPKIALIGPNAFYAQMGSHTCYGALQKEACPDAVSEQAITPIQAFAAKFGSSNVQAIRGCNFTKVLPEDQEKMKSIISSSDLILFAGGNNSIGYSGGENGGKNNPFMKDDAVTSGEGYDRDEIGLSPSQKELLASLRECGKPIVLIIYGGKPVSLTDELPYLSAVLFAFGVGTDGNRAIADILAGDINPSGKLPFSIARSVGQLPCYYNHGPLHGIYDRPGSREVPGQDYVFADKSPLFSFGDGLSYSKITYHNLQIEKQGEHYQASVDVANESAIPAEEVVLLYCHSLSNAWVPAPVKSLRAYRRISLASSEKKRVSFTLSGQDFAYLDETLQWRVPQGKAEILCGGLTAGFQL